MVPLNMSMTDDDIHYVCDHILRFIGPNEYR